MSKARKTFAVDALKARVNHALAYETPLSVDATEAAQIARRSGEADLLASVLHETGNYKGFRYLQAHELPKGSKPGIIFGENGQHEYPDPSRRFYY